MKKRFCAVCGKENGDSLKKIPKTCEYADLGEHICMNCCRICTCFEGCSEIQAKMKSNLGKIMTNSRVFQFFSVIFALFLMGCTTYNFTIYQGKPPLEEAKLPPSVGTMSETKPSEPASVTTGKGSNLIYLYIFSDGTTTVTSSATVPISPFREGEGR